MEGISWLQKTLKGARRSPSPTSGLQPKIPVLEREVPTITGCENKWIVAWLQVFHLKGLCTYLLMDSLNEFQHWISSLKDARDMWWGTELSGFRGRLEGAAFSQIEVLAESIIFLLDPPHPPNTVQMQADAYLSLHQLANTGHSTNFPRSLPTPLLGPAKPQWFFHKTVCLVSCYGLS